MRVGVRQGVEKYEIARRKFRAGYRLADAAHRQSIGRQAEIECGFENMSNEAATIEPVARIFAAVPIGYAGQADCVEQHIADAIRAWRGCRDTDTWLWIGERSVLAGTGKRR